MMRDLWEVCSRTFAVVRRGRLDREFDEEFAAHLELLSEQNERRGLDPHEARRQAILQMGGLNATKTFHRESRGLPWLERWLEALQAIGKDFRHAARSLARARAFTLVCVLSLGVGMGAFVALVTFIRAASSPARVIDTNGLVELLVTPLGTLRAKLGAEAVEEWSYPDFQELRQADTGMTLAGWAMGATETGMRGPDDQAPARAFTFYVSSNYFRIFGVSLARGAGFDTSDDRPSAAPRVVVSHAFWRNRMASDPDVIGKTLVLDGVAHAVVGIAPEDFDGPFNALSDRVWSAVLFLPLERHPRLRDDPSLRVSRSLDWVHIHGRLLPGVDLTQANAMVAALVSGLSRHYPASNEFKAAAVEPYLSHGAARRQQMRRASTMMLGLAGMVLLIVCVNLSGMMLVRGAARERELSIREAVGASRQRLIQYLFFEAVWLAAIGGGLSVMVLYGIPAAVARALDGTVPPELDFDATAIAVCAGLCVSVSLVLGLLPALRASRPNLIPALKDDVAGGGRRVSRVHRAAAAIQVAIAVPFLVVSGVLLDRLRTADFGFATDGLVAARMDPAAASAQGRSDGSLRSMRAALAQADGVRSVTLADGMPIDFDEHNVRAWPSSGTVFASARVTHVAEGYLETLGTRLLRGRSITAADRGAAARVAVISEPLAAKIFPPGEAVGGQLMLALDEGREEAFTVIGVSADFATSQLTTARPQVLLPLPEQPASAVYLIARGAASDEGRLTSTFENLGRDLGLTFLPGRIKEFRDIVTGTQLVQKSLHDLAFESIAVAVAGGIVLLLAALGVLGVIAFMVATRTREIAVRMALGASRTRVIGLMLYDVVKLVAPGVAVGLVIGAVLIRSISEVMGTPLTVGPTPLGAVEPLIYAGAAVVSIAVALLAGLPPARRAASIQPMTAMRLE